MISISEPYIANQEFKAVERVLESKWFIHGKYIKKFEKSFSEYIGTNYAIGCSNGTSALQMALECIPKGKVIVPSHTAFPTIEAIYRAGHIPEFIDIDETYNLDPTKLKYKKNVTAVLGVHLYGHPFDVQPVMEFCNEHNVYLIEDCAQAVGAKYKNKKVGSFGDLACFSFFPSKNMTVCGDGGMIVTNSKDFKDQILLLRNHGMSDRYTNMFCGHNFRLGEIQSAIGLVQLRKLDIMNVKRRILSGRYDNNLPNEIIPIEKSYAYHVYHLYVIKTFHRNRVKKKLNEVKIPSEIHYPIPTHKSLAINSSIRLPYTEKIVDEILTLPMHPGLTVDDVDYICEKVNEFL